MALAVDLQDISFSYRDWEHGAHQACAPLFSHLSVSLEQGQRMLVLAPPGSGKTTLARMMVGMIPKYMDGTLTGSLCIDGVNLADIQPWDLVTRCGYVSQNPLDELVATTCEDEIAFPLESLGMPRYEIVRRVRSALDMWGLVPMQGASAQQLSGGERKRLLLAVQEAVDPHVWILDESFDDLDEQWREKLLKRISSRKQSTIVFAARYIDQFRGTFDSYAMMSDGQLQVGSEDEIVLAFNQLCDSQGTQDDEQEPMVLSEKHIFSCVDLQVERTRSSAPTLTPFRLDVPHFALESNTITSLCGPNGSGKSTFSRLACGLDKPDSGTILIDGVAATSAVLNRSVGYLFQNPDFQIFLPTVADELAWSLRRAKLGKDAIKAKVQECADLFHLDVAATPATMSFGLRKTLQAAVYYLLDRPFYILDELDSALTYERAFELIQLLARNGAGILLITHDKTFADAVASKSYVIESGRMHQEAGR